MSYTSENILGSGATLIRVKEIVDLLKYRPIDDGLKIPHRVGSYIWFEQSEYKSWVGVELNIYKEGEKNIVVTTRTSIGRSYWDLMHQNKTIKMIRDLFGGDFSTDEGRNRYLRPSSGPPSPRESGCYLARWRLHNALIRPKRYLAQRREEFHTLPRPSGNIFIDGMNPYFFSNNLIVPYLVAIWEEFFRASFISLFKYCSRKERVLKNISINKFQLEQVASGIISFEEAVASSCSFQRPRVIGANFKMVDTGLNLLGVLQRPYGKHKWSLFEKIELCVEDRNRFVHSGDMNLQLTDGMLEVLFIVFETAVERCYQEFSQKYEFGLPPYHWNVFENLHNLNY